MRYSHRKLYCSDNPRKNILEFEDKFFEITDLSESGSKGGNSSVFKLFDPNNESYLIIKFCKFYLSDKNPNWIKHRIDRFYREVEALQKAQDHECDNVISLKFNGKTVISKRTFLYYVMEIGEADLNQHLSDHEIPIEQKVLLCHDILKGVNQLHTIDIYHRDLKPDNIFYISDLWKVGDLGLIAYRQEEQKFDLLKEKIGPYGWLSPEAMNKAMCEGTDLEEAHNCHIGPYSDVFQLGKLFWYIFEGNIPIGQIYNDDFQTSNPALFGIINNMLSYSYLKRPDMNSLISRFEDLSDELL